MIDLEAEVLQLVVELSLEYMAPLGIEVLLDLVVVRVVVVVMAMMVGAVVRVVVMMVMLVLDGGK
jgi:hypothetical protein